MGGSFWYYGMDVRWVLSRGSNKYFDGNHGAPLLEDDEGRRIDVKDQKYIVDN